MKHTFLQKHNMMSLSSFTSLLSAHLYRMSTLLIRYLTHFNRVFITNPSIVYMGSQRQFSLLYFGCGLDSFALRQLVMSLGLGISHFGHF